MRALVVALGILTAAPVAHAQDGPGLEWEGRPRFGWTEGAVTGMSVAGALVLFGLGSPEQSRWHVLNDFDVAVRDAWIAPTTEEQELYATISDAFFGVLLGLPVVDALLFAGLARGSSDVALQTVLLDVEVLTIGFFLTMLTTRQVARERPMVQDCRSEGRPIEECGDGTGRNVSFLSGHAVMDYAAAGLICTSHLEHPLLGELWADVAVCGAVLGLATAGSVMRLPADRHWATDVIAGAGVGLLLGIAFPYLTHHADFLRDANVQVVPSAPGAEAGISIGGAL